MERVFHAVELFTSIQGEGAWVGTPMLFLRLAGCNVGKPAKALKENPFPMLPSGKEAKACTTWDGRVFPCDTDWEKATLEVAPKDVLDKAYAENVIHICITGGEPLLQKEAIAELINICAGWSTVHIETSGTLPLKGIDPDFCWITCSPKLCALEETISVSDEVKLMVDENFDWLHLPDSILHHPDVYVCPINGLTEINQHNVDICWEILKHFPQWRMGVQLHKIYHMR